MEELQISNPQGIDLKKSLKDWFKIDNLKSNSFWSRRSGMLAMVIIAIIGAVLVGGIIANVGAILFWIGALVAKIIIATVVGVAAFLLWNNTTRYYIKTMLVGFCETVTLEYVRKHPLVALSAFWAFVVDRIRNLQSAISNSKKFNKNVEREIEKVSGRIDGANSQALNAENNKDEILRNSYLNMALELTKTKQNYIKLKQVSEGYIQNAEALLRVANSKKIATENEIDIYKTKHAFNTMSTDLIANMRSVIFPNAQILSMYQAAKDSIDNQYDDNLLEMDTLMDQLNAMPSVESLQNPVMMQNAIQQFEEWKQQSITVKTQDKKPEAIAASVKEPAPTGDIQF